MKIFQEEVRSAQIQFQEETDWTETMKFKGKLVGALGSISDIKGKMKRHNVLFEWIEQQRREISSDPVDAENEGGHSR